MADRVTARTKMYLKAVREWKAPFEVANIIRSAASVRLVVAALLALEERGLVEHHEGNNTFRLTDAGRALLASEKRE